MGRNFFFAIIITGLLSSLSFAYSGGAGTAADPYQIATKTDLLTLAATTADYSKCFILTADIDFTGEAFTTAVIASDTDDSNYDFDGIEFTGTLDGNAHQIKNLTINGGSNHYIGLLGQTGGDGQIKNLAIVNANIQGNYYVGGLAGGNFGMISSCYTTGTVSGNGCVGGLVGFNYWGILGYYEDTIRFCYAAGEVSGDESIGGLVGTNCDSTIISCFATGAVNGYSAVGGLLGKNETSFMLDLNETGKVISCYAAGSVSGYSIIGGLLGFNAAGKVIYCYSTGMLTGTEDVGGLVGESVNFEKHCETVCHGPSCVEVCNYDAVPDPSLIEYSFWDTQTSGQTFSDGGTGKMTAEMKTLSTFTSAGWDFTNETTNGTNDIWRMCTNGLSYPKLNWESIDGDFACPDGVNIEDFNYYVGRWLMNCTATNNYCGGADMDSSGIVNLADFALFAENWLGGI